MIADHEDYGTTHRGIGEFRKEDMIIMDDPGSASIRTVRNQAALTMLNLHSVKVRTARGDIPAGTPRTFQIAIVYPSQRFPPARTCGSPIRLDARL